MFKLKYIPLSLFCIFFTKALVHPTQWVDVAMCAVLAAVSFLYENKALNTNAKETLELINTQNAKITAVEKATEDLKGSVSGLRISQVRKF